MGSVSLFRRLVLCPLQMCPFVQAENDTHLWGECIHCGKRDGEISRAVVRRYLEAEALYRDHLASIGKPFNPACIIPREFFDRVDAPTPFDQFAADRR